MSFKFKTNLEARLFTCIIGIPSLVALIFLLPGYNFIGISILAVIFSLGGSIETSRLAFNKTDFTVVFAALIPLLEYLQCLLSLKTDISNIALVFFVIITLCREIGISGTEDDFKNSIERSGKRLLILIYPAYFCSFIVKMLALEVMTSASVMLFFALVFGNDIFAYVFGMLFGRKQKGYVVKASPHKSWAGFIGGTLSCIAIALIWFEAFKSSMPVCSISIRLSLGLLVSFSANAGDILESVLKRSAGVKDSGNIIPGRGGFLDNIDSLLTAAPVFFLLYSII